MRGGGFSKDGEQGQVAGERRKAQAHLRLPSCTPTPQGPVRVELTIGGPAAHTGLIMSAGVGNTLYSFLAESLATTGWLVYLALLISLESGREVSE